MVSGSEMAHTAKMLNNTPRINHKAKSK